MRTVKSCIGSTWCRYGVQDSTALAIRIEERYRGIRAPHKLKSAVSGCIRECAEAQSKDFGVIATEKGWNLYVCGNGGVAAAPRRPDRGRRRRGDADPAHRPLPHVLHPDRATRSSARRAGSSGSTAASTYLKRVVVDDALGICAQLERDMQQLVDTLRVRVGGGGARSRSAARRSATSPTRRAADPTSAFVRERGQKRPARLAGRGAAAAAAPPRRGDGGVGARRRAPPTCPRDGGVTVALRRRADRGLPLREPRRLVRDARRCARTAGHGARARPARHAGRRAEGRLPDAQEDLLARDRRRARPIRSTGCRPSRSRCATARCGCSCRARGATRRRRRCRGRCAERGVSAA